jgi:DNA-binding response OmpR family regulator
MITMPRLIVVDDEADLREMVAEYLTRNGCAVRTAADGRQLDALLAAGPADLVILDITMPGEDGLSIARRLVAGAEMSIIMLTAAGEPPDRVVGLELGADDYIAKPPDLRELLARVRSVLRRPKRALTASGGDIRGAGKPSNDSCHEQVPLGAVRFDQAARRLIKPDGQELRLTAMEYDLLLVFTQNPNRVLTRERLLDLAHHREEEPFDRSIDIRIARIRRKIEIDPAKPQVIRTIRGGGYMFVPPKS